MRTNNMTFFDDDIKKKDGVVQDTEPVFGIDLGTTNSAISVISTGDMPEAIELKDHRLTIPSCVMWKNGEFIVGQEAYENREKANVIYSVKRFMQKPGKTVTFKETSSKTLTMTPAQVSAEILKGLIKETNGIWGEIRDVVVTVPAYFDQNGRNATREACELAGLNLIDILNEPTAASLCYKLDAGSKSKDIVIFDLGGGTFDATLARITNTGSVSGDISEIYGIASNEGKRTSKVISCLGIDGDSYLGGDDIDLELRRIVFEKIRENGFEPDEMMEEYKESLLVRLERLKKSGTENSYEVNINTITKRGKEINCCIGISPAIFAKALEPTYKKCKKIVQSLITKYENSADTIVLVGGSTKNEQLVAKIKQDFPTFSVFDGIGQDLAVSLGAAIKGKIAKFGDDNVQVFDILPITIGANCAGKMIPIATQGSMLPITASIPFTTVSDNQTEMELEIIQGNSSEAEDCVSLGILTFTDIKKAKAGEPDLWVSLTINTRSQLSCVGSIDGVKKTLKLDLTGIANKSNNNDLTDKLKRKWLKLAENMNESDSVKFKSLLSGFPDKVNKEEIFSFLYDRNGNIDGSKKR